MHMLWDYRREKWWDLVSKILNKALTCAYLLANVQDYVTLSIEALGKNIIVPNKDKKRILDNLMAVLKVCEQAINLINNVLLISFLNLHT